jgi:hypothetical protein
MAENEKDNIEWVWDKCYDIHNKYNPKEGFDELKQLLTKRKRVRLIRRSVFISVPAAAVIFIFILFSTGLFHSRTSPADITDGHKNMSVDKSVFFIKAGDKTYVNMFKKSVMHITEKSLAFKNRNKTEAIPVQGNENVLINIPPGMRYSVVLRDGSRIWATSNSVISVSENFSDNERRIKASGNLFFEISKSDVPFIIELKNNLAVKVYGTIFNVESYADSSLTRICLNEGKVSLKIGEKERFLLPDESLLYDNDDQSLSVRKMEKSERAVWKNGYIYINEMPLENLAKELSKWYGVSDYFFDEAIKTVKFSGNLPDTLNIEDIVKILNSTKKCMVKYEEGEMRFYK